MFLLFIEEDFRIASVLRHRDEGWNKVEVGESDTSDINSDHVEDVDEEEEEEFPPPPPQIAAVVKTIKLGEAAEFRLNIQVSDVGKHIPSPTRLVAIIIACYLAFSNSLIHKENTKENHKRIVS